MSLQVMADLVESALKLFSFRNNSFGHQCSSRLHWNFLDVAIL